MHLLITYDLKAPGKDYADALGVEPKLLANPQAVQALRLRQRVRHIRPLLRQSRLLLHLLRLRPLLAQRLHRLRVRQQLRLNPSASA